MPPMINALVPKLELNDHDEHCRLQTAIDDACCIAYKDEPTSKLQTLHNSLEDNFLKPAESARVAISSSFYAANETSIKTTAPALASAVDTIAIEDGVKTFAESSRVLMKALDGISQVHPFIAVTVLAFKAVITLELTRRENDQKIIAIKLKMKDMMSVLLELRNIRDPADIAPDGRTIQGRMQSLMQQIATDIMECGNACDTYIKKNIIVRVLNSPVWEGRLADFVTVFEKHRTSIAFSLQIHTSLAVESANHALLSVHQNVQSVDQKLAMLLLFRTLDSPHEKELMKVVSTRGGPKACLDDDAILKELMSLPRGKGSVNLTASRRTKSGAADRVELAQVKMEMQEDVDKSMERNKVIFEGKLELQKRQLVKEMEDVVRREGDRVISALSGPHDRIIDSDLHAIWKEMGWRGSVKARNFVLALRDYFHERYDEIHGLDNVDHLRSSSIALSEAGSTVANDFNLSLTSASADNRGRTQRRPNDQWAFAYISILRVQSVLEAFDEDASGFISIKEVNLFSSTRPPNWTLAGWLAYWAAGWHYSVWDYRGKIKMIIKTMFSMLENILPINRRLVYSYIENYSFGRVELLLRSVIPYDSCDDNDLRENIQPYIAEEEERLRSMLESVAWDIDTMDTLALITGPERIEKIIFPLLYLVLDRHMRIIHLARTEVLVDFELNHASEALYLIVSTADERIAKLSAIFKNNNIDVSAQLGNVALGMFQLLHNPALAMNLDEDTEFVPPYCDDSLYQTDTSILKFGAQGDEFDRVAYDCTDAEPVTTLDVAGAGLSIMKGIWTGLYFYATAAQTDGLMQINIHTSSKDGSFCGGGTDDLDTFTLSGRIKHSTETEMEVRFVKDYTRLQYGQKISWIYHGSLDVATGTISGQWGTEAHGDFGTFRMGRAPAWAHQFRYSLSELKENAALARWSFAGATALYQAKQQLWSWSFFKDRRTIRKRFLELFTRRELTNAWYFARDSEFHLTEEEARELQVLEGSLPPADARSYRAIGRSEVRLLCVHFNVSCDACDSTVVGPRTTCLICVSEGYDSQIDLCHRCLGIPIRTPQFTHSPLHDMVQIRRVVHSRDTRSLITSAKEAVDRGKFALGGSEQMESTNVGVGSQWYCSCCSDPICLPCWFCMTCAIETFICDACNAANLKGKHSDAHPFIRLNKNTGAEWGAIEGRLLSLEIRSREDWRAMSERLGRLAQRFEEHEKVMNDRLTALEIKFEGRLARVEGLLSLIASKLPS